MPGLYPTPGRAISVTRQSTIAPVRWTSGTGLSWQDHGVRRDLKHPTRLVPIGFAGLIAVGTLLLALPVSSRSGAATDPLTALFTASSAGCVTGLTVVDTGTYWSGFGHVVILALCQVGGFGIMAFATLLGMLVARRGFGFQSRLATQAETHTLGLGDVPSVLRKVLVLTVATEAIAALVLAARFHLGYDYAWPKALWHGLFHSVSAFNNAGLSLNSNNMMGFASDAWVCVTLALAVLIGGLGFPVLLELRRRFRAPATWSIHTKLTVGGSVFLLAAGFTALLATEWTNARTLGPMDVPGKALTAFFHAVMPRSGGFNTVDVGEMHSDSLFTIDILMFIGGGSAGTAGGIKITTFLLLAYVIWAEIRGEPEVNVYGRHVERSAQRQALTIALLSTALIAGGTLLMLKLTNFSLDQVLFESISAFSTNGLSTGITPALPGAGQLLLVILMFVGRVGTITVASALALRGRQRLYKYPEERPIVG